MIAVAAALAWVPSWTASGFLTPLGLLCVAAGWRSAPRRWLLWLGLVFNALVLAATAALWLPWVIERAV